MIMQCFSLAVNHLKHYNNYTTDQIISLMSAVQHLHYEIKQSFLKLCFMWGRGGGGGERRGAFVLGRNCSRGKLICCFVLELVYLTFITVATYLPIRESDFSVNVRKNSKF